MSDNIFNFKYGDKNKALSSDEIRIKRIKLAKKFKKDVDNGAIDCETNELFKLNEHKATALYDRIADTYRDLYVYQEEFITFCFKMTKLKYWKKASKLSNNSYYTYDFSYIFKNMDDSYIKEILLNENYEICKT